MNVTFKNKKLEKFANSDSKGLGGLGQKRFQKFKKRLDQLSASKSLEDVRHQPGRFHELTHTKKGQWACDLDHPYRLIFEPQENPIPTDRHGTYIWAEIKAVRIIEIDDYH